MNFVGKKNCLSALLLLLLAVPASRAAQSFDDTFVCLPDAAGAKPGTLRATPEGLMAASNDGSGKESSFGPVVLVGSAYTAILKHSLPTEDGAGMLSTSWSIDRVTGRFRFEMRSELPGKPPEHAVSVGQCTGVDPPSSGRQPVRPAAMPVAQASPNSAATSGSTCPRNRLALDRMLAGHRVLPKKQESWTPNGSSGENHYAPSGFRFLGATPAEVEVFFFRGEPQDLEVLLSGVDIAAYEGAFRAEFPGALTKCDRDGCIWNSHPDITSAPAGTLNSVRLYRSITEPNHTTLRCSYR